MGSLEIKTRNTVRLYFIRLTCEITFLFSIQGKSHTHHGFQQTNYISPSLRLNLFSLVLGGCGPQKLEQHHIPILNNELSQSLCLNQFSLVLGGLWTLRGRMAPYSPPKTYHNVAHILGMGDLSEEATYSPRAED